MKHTGRLRGSKVCYVNNRLMLYFWSPHPCGVYGKIENILLFTFHLVSRKSRLQQRLTYLKMLKYCHLKTHLCDMPMSVRKWKPSHHTIIIYKCSNVSELPLLLQICWNIMCMHLMFKT